MNAADKYVLDANDTLYRDTFFSASSRVIYDRCLRYSVYNYISLHTILVLGYYTWKRKGKNVIQIKRLVDLKEDTFFTSLCKQPYYVDTACN